MAPYKGIRTYANSRKKPLSLSGRALNTLLAVNLKKRLETSTNTSGPSKEKSLETTFDRLLKGEFYNNVQFRNNPVIEKSSVFSVSNNTINEDQSIIQSSNSKCSPERNSLQTQSDGTNGHVNIENESLVQKKRRERHDRFKSKMLLMDSLELARNKNDSFLNFERSVVGVSTPQNYYLRKRQRPSSLKENKNNTESGNLNSTTTKRFDSSVLSKEQDSLSINHSHSTINHETTNKRGYTRKKSSHRDELSSITYEDEIIEIEDSLNPTTSSTPLHRNFSTVEDYSTSLLTKSYRIINEWSNRCPSPNSFSSSHQSKTDSKKKKIEKKYEFKRRKDSKLYKKTQVILKHMPHLDDVLKKACENSMSFEIKFFNVKKASDVFITKRKIATDRKKSELAENRSDRLESSKLERSYVRLESLGELTKRLTLNRNSSELNSTSDFKKHRCFIDCQHFRKVPKVMLEKSPENVCARKSNNSDVHFDVSNSSTPFSSPNFRGFDASQRNSYSNRKKSQDNKVETESNSPSNKNNFRIKDCYVILERMNFDSISDRRKIQSELEQNESKKRLSDCWVVLNDSKNRSGESDENDVLQELNFKLLRKNFVTLEPGKKFRRSIAMLKKSLEEEFNLSGRKNPSRMTALRRQSVRIIPVTPTKNQPNELASFALNNSGYASLRQSGRRSSLEEVENFLSNVQPVNDYLNCRNKNIADQLTARDIVLKRCGQTQPLNFEQCYPTSALQHCQKIGEGVFGEVFMIRDKDGSTTVMKVIPIEGEQIVNLEKQKTFGEILSEIIISMELSNLRITKRNNTDAFVKVKNIRCVEGCYPDRLLELWELYDENKQSENDSPEMFLSNQLYIVLELANAGQDLESFQFTNAQQSLAVFEQIACALAVAESQLQFEHRDLHWGNVLITPTENKNTIFVLDGKEIIVNNRGVKATIIDFTLSRVEYEGVIIFNDLSMDVDLFTAKGDYQFDIYRKMQDHNGNRWQTFKPYSNILWLHYILGKAISGFRYRNVKSKQHRSSMTILKAYEDQILDYNSTADFIEKNFSSQILIH